MYSIPGNDEGPGGEGGPIRKAQREGPGETERNNVVTCVYGNRYKPVIRDFGGHFHSIHCGKVAWYEYPLGIEYGPRRGGYFSLVG